MPRIENQDLHLPGRSSQRTFLARQVSHPSLDLVTFRGFGVGFASFDRLSAAGAIFENDGGGGWHGRSAGSQVLCFYLDSMPVAGNVR